MGSLYEAYNNLSGDYHEKYYQRAVAEILESKNIDFVREFRVDITIKGSKIGHHFVDFLVENKLILELKRGNKINLRDIKQVLMYLNTINLKLGMLAYFGSEGVKVKRLINKHYHN